MTGLPNKNKEEFNRYKNELITLGYDVVSPPDLDNEPDTGYDDNYYRLLRLAISQMLTCDMVALLPGWKSSRGAKLEFVLSYSVRLPVVKADDLISPKEGVV